MRLNKATNPLSDIRACDWMAFRRVIVGHVNIIIHAGTQNLANDEPNGYNGDDEYENTALPLS